MLGLSESRLEVERIFLLLTLPLLFSPQILAAEQIEQSGVIRWVRGDQFNPNNGEPTGVEMLSDKIIPTYLAVAYSSGKWVCGKYAPAFGRAYFDFILYDNSETNLSPSQFYVLEAPPGTIRWVKTNRHDRDRKDKSWFMCGGSREPTRYTSQMQSYPCRYTNDAGHLLTGWVWSHHSGGEPCRSSFAGRAQKWWNDVEYPVWTEYGKAIVNARKRGWLKKYGKE